MSIKKCPYCGDELEVLEHGNRKYCCDEHYYKAKLVRNGRNYAKHRKQLNEFQRIDAILKMYFLKYQNDFISASLLEDAEMNWGISCGEILFEEVTVKVIGKYGYALFQNETIKIYQI